ncbi:hypothetical protein [Actinacidiphila glaucinigra]|uniref:Uncharacterized protein n=1 Tax=Actinacidiphila glaucinigra TaxID=235986 RepID=A0A239ITD6_9ACTN|nr:hypothetical protein [Actinacidiphila glaucinigra]SNS96829.1 hypothetical protein SAMN05216252_111117 [Actinacidiphila glaucinigra]
MAADIVFFLAPDDETAARTRLKGPGPALTSVVCHDVTADDAVVEWEMYMDAPSTRLPPQHELNKRDWPRYVAPILNDGVGVFVLSARLTSALANATPALLEGLAARWTARLRLEDGDDMTDDDLPTVLKGIAELAAAADASRGALGLYCWHD